MSADTTIRIDRDVKAALQKAMRPVESYNAALRRLLKLDKRNGRSKRG